MKPATLLALPLALCLSIAAYAWAPHPLVRLANTYVTRGFVCYGTAFTEIDSLDALPPPVLQLVKDEAGKELVPNMGFRVKAISDRGGPFNPTDVYADDRPHLRFIIGALSKDVALIAVERGGYGYNQQMWSFLRTASGWEAAPAGYLPYDARNGTGGFQHPGYVLAQAPANSVIDLKTMLDSPVLDAQKDMAYFLPQARQLFGCAPGIDHGKVETDAELAKALLQDAQQGDAPAQFALAHLYASGRGVTMSPAEAQAWYGKAAAGQSDMQYDLAYDYANGIDLPQDYVTAMHWFRLSSDAKDDALKWLSYIQLGMLYADGKGVPVNKVAAYALFLMVPGYHYDPLAARKEALEASMSKDEIAQAKALQQSMYFEAHDKGTVTDTLDGFLSRSGIK